ncbi:MAG: YqjK-like family protein [Gallionella sp.]|nr:YqjK-like family protein [Gallionella sp.]
MNKHDIILRRRVLLEKIHSQRADMAEIALQFHTPLQVFDTGLNAVLFVRRHPALVTGAVAIFVALRRKSLSETLRQGWRILSFFPSTERLTRYFPGK